MSMESIFSEKKSSSFFPFFPASAAERKERKERSRRLYGELQTVLKSRADRWREREADELRRLGRPPRLEDPET